MIYDESRLLTIYKEIDEDGDGEITLEELRKALCTCGVFLTDLQLKQTFEVVDTNDDGKISYFEFVDYFTPHAPLATLKTISNRWINACKYNCDLGTEIVTLPVMDEVESGP